MAKVKLTFDLHEERNEFGYALHGVAYSNVLNEILQYLHNRGETSDVVEIEELRHRILVWMEDHGVNS